MGSSHEHPSLTLPVTPEQRGRAEDLLKQAYAEGRIDEPEFHSRIGQVLAAHTRKDLNAAFYGLVEIPESSAAPTDKPVARPEPDRPDGRGAAAFAHFSVFLLWLLGPGLIYAVSPAGSYARNQAARAFNFQLLAAVVLVPLYIITGINGFDALDWLLTMVGLSWFVLTLVGGGKALRGEDWRNPVTSAVKLRVLPDE